MPNRTLVLNSEQIEQRTVRIAHEIYEKNFEEKELIVAGIAPNGYIFAKKLTKILEDISPLKIKLVEIRVNKKNPIEEKAKFEFKEKELKDKSIVLVDDVLNSGKTLIYAAKPFLKSPIKRLSAAVLVDRNHTRFPIKANFVGISISTTLQEHISVELESKGKESVFLM